MITCFGASTGTEREGFLPKKLTGVTNFLEQYPAYDGRGIRIAVLDSGVDPGASGLKSTSLGSPKLIDILDATGSGDVDTSTIVQPSTTGTITGLGGKNLTLSPHWLEPGRQFHLGIVRGFDLFTEDIRQQYQNMAEKAMIRTNQYYINQAENAWQSMEDTIEPSEQDSADEMTDLRDQLELLRQLGQDFEAPSPVYDCLVFEQNGIWNAVIDTDEDGDFRNEIILQNYSIHHKHAHFGPWTLVNFTVNIRRDGNLLSIVIPSSAHGTHVAGIIGAYYPDAPERNGISPGAQIVSIKIGDSRLNGMETGIAIQRALRMARDQGCDLINMSYGEPTSTPNEGWFIKQVNELVYENNVIFVASAGNAGPALGTVGAPGGTTSSILAIGAYVHQSMMPLQYGMPHLPQNNLYTWSSRGPTIDGDLGVNLCAPGGAIAPVPAFSLQPAMQMNGTSMAAPYACGSIALILSGLKSSSISWNPYGVRMALQESARGLEGIDTFSQGAGLIQVGSAFEQLTRGLERDAIKGFEIRNPSSSTSRGIYLREPAKTKKPSNHKLFIEPIFSKNVTLAEKANFEIWAELTSSVDWIRFPHSVLIHQQQGSISVEVDPTKLPPGAHTATIRGRDMSSAQVLFHIPVHIIIPELKQSKSPAKWSSSVKLEPGDIARFFLHPPPWADWAKIRIESTGMREGDRLAIHTMQLEKGKTFEKTQWKRYVDSASLQIFESTIPVAGDRLMEWAFASYWSNTGNLAMRIRIVFSGLANNLENVVLKGGNIPVSVQLGGRQQSVHIRPEGRLDIQQFTLLPITATLRKSTDPRNLMLDGKMMHRLELVYEWENIASTPINLAWHALAKVLYDSPYASVFWTLEDSYGRIIHHDDAWSLPISISAGKHRLILETWHETDAILEPLKEMPVIIRQKLKKPIPIEIAKSLADATTLRSLPSPSSTLHPSEIQPFWLWIRGNTPPNEKSVDLDSLYTGTVHWLGNKYSDIPAAKTRVTWIPALDNSTENTSKGHSATHLSHTLTDLIWATKISHLKTLAADRQSPESYDTLEAKLRDERPYSRELDSIRLERLDGPDRKQHIFRLLNHLEKMLTQVDIHDVRQFFSKRHEHLKLVSKVEYKKMETERDYLVDLLYRKARALAYQETFTGEQTPLFDEALEELRSWSDTHAYKYRLLDIREYRRQQYYGKALKLLRTMLTKTPDIKKLLKKQIKLLESLNWEYWSNHFQKKMHVYYPEEVPDGQVEASIIEY
ncbi:MAG: S8 family serine peptidase [Verrucomicrobiota bacterium]|nr:S8 family serine peptidase [Verrucomicrobiota bacterium]